jgi:hypothetical protein
VIFANIFIILISIYSSYFYKKMDCLSCSIPDEIILVEIQNYVIRNDVFRKRLLLYLKNVSYIDSDTGRSANSPVDDSGNQETDAAAADETEQAVEPEADAEAEPEQESEHVAEPETEAEANTEPESESEPKTTATEAKILTQTETETKSESAVEAKEEVPRSGSPKEKEEIK